MKHLSKKLDDFNTVTVALKDDAVTIADARVLFDAVATTYPMMKDRLSPQARIIDNPRFESGILKVQNKREGDLNGLEKTALRDFQKCANDLEKSDRVDTSSQNFAMRALKRMKISEETTSASNYLDLRFILATSNICERLFSVAGYTLSDRRKSLLPVNFEIQLFLNVNARFWSIADIYELIK